MNPMAIAEELSITVWMKSWNGGSYGVGNHGNGPIVG